jgi:glutathione-independent formaldehyde dehydrogenase
VKAVVYEDVRTVGVHEVADATIEADSDAVVRVTSSAICGTDLHMYDGRTGAQPGLVLGRPLLPGQARTRRLQDRGNGLSDPR